MQLNKNKIVNLSAGFLLLFLVLINLIIYSYPNIVSKYFTIKTVIINGSVNSDENQIRKSVIKYKANLIEPNSLKIKDSVESNAWVKRASVKKIFPSTLLIEIIENDPFAIYLEEGKSYLIDIDGSIITQINLDNHQEKLLFVRGKSSSMFLETIIKDLSIGFPSLIKNLDELEFVEERRWNLKLKNNLLIKLPDENIQKSLSNLKSLFENQKVMESNIIEIDMRIQGRASIKILDSKLNFGIDEI